MLFKAKLNHKFFIVSVLLLCLVIFGWYGIYFLNANEILMEDNTPMTYEIKLLFSAAMSVIVLSWTASFFALLRQIFIGCAFTIDEKGIHSTVTAINVLAFIFVVPIRTIPYSAIKNISEENGAVTLHIDKSKIEMNSFLRIFASKRYNLFSGFTTEKTENIKAEINKYIDLN